VTSVPAHLETALSKIGLNEYQHRTVLHEFLAVDPRRVEWCAAFVNAVVRDGGMNSLSEQGHHNPWAARSWLDWGEPVSTPKPGDVVVFPRGNVVYQGHVGFYLGSIQLDGIEYYQILGGNQNNSVSIVLYSASKSLGIRRYKYEYDRELRSTVRQPQKSVSPFERYRS